MGNQKIKYTFSGHESFYCKSLWLKKGFDHILSGKTFNSDDAVVDLGVGKNMVASIRYWMKSFGLTENDNLVDLAKDLLNDEDGYDPYLEDLGTLWLLHYLLVSRNNASIYNLMFRYFRKEKNGEFNRDQVALFIKRKCEETGNSLLYNDNTVKRDIGVFLQNYVIPTPTKTNEDYAALLLGLNLIKMVDSKTYYFNESSKSSLIKEIFLYAVIDTKGDDNTVTFDVLMDLASIFCMSKAELVDTLINLTESYPNTVQYSDNSGIKQLIFIKQLDKNELLRQYYRH